MQLFCSFLELLQTLKQTLQVHSYSAPALCFPDMSEARVGEQAVKLKSCTRSEHALLHRIYGKRRLLKQGAK